MFDITSTVAPTRLIDGIKQRDDVMIGGRCASSFGLSEHVRHRAASVLTAWPWAGSVVDSQLSRPRLCACSGRWRCVISMVSLLRICFGGTSSRASRHTFSKAIPATREVIYVRGRMERMISPAELVRQHRTLRQPRSDMAALAKLDGRQKHTKSSIKIKENGHRPDRKKKKSNRKWRHSNAKTKQHRSSNKRKSNLSRRLA